MSGVLCRLKIPHRMVAIVAVCLATFAACKKAEPPQAPRPEFYGVKVDLEKLEAALTNADPEVAGLVGADTAAVVRRRLASLERLGDRFDALVEGLPLLRAFGRARDHERAVAASGEEVHATTLATLRLALAGWSSSSWRPWAPPWWPSGSACTLDSGQRIFPQALAVLMLTPEVFLPLRRLTADFHRRYGQAVLAPAASPSRIAPALLGASAHRRAGSARSVSSSKG